MAEGLLVLVHYSSCRPCQTFFGFRVYGSFFACGGLGLRPAAESRAQVARECRAQGFHRQLEIFRI